MRGVRAAGGCGPLPGVIEPLCRIHLQGLCSKALGCGARQEEFTALLDWQSGAILTAIAAFQSAPASPLHLARPSHLDELVPQLTLRIHAVKSGQRLSAPPLVRCCRYPTLSAAAPAAAADAVEATSLAVPRPRGSTHAAVARRQRPSVCCPEGCTRHQLLVLLLVGLCLQRGQDGIKRAFRRRQHCGR